MAQTKVKIDQSYFKIAKEGILKVKKNILSIISLDQNKIEYILASKIAGGHVILADSHGVGKTSLARSLANSIEWKKARVTSDGIAAKNFNRIQCTVDMLPQDILGFNRFDMKNNHYQFNAGPIFSHFVLCDEINLLTPKTQGSFFQAMEEQIVSIEGQTYILPNPFFYNCDYEFKRTTFIPTSSPTT